MPRIRSKGCGTRRRHRRTNRPIADRAPGEDSATPLVSPIAIRASPWKVCYTDLPRLTFAGQGRSKKEGDMRSVIRKQVRWAHLLGGAILVCVALMNSARADFFRVDLLGSYTYQSAMTPFATSFYIDTTCGGTSTNCAISVPLTQPGGIPIIAYPLPAVAGVSLSVAGIQFPRSDIILSLQPAAVVLFNEPLANGATPLTSISFISRATPSTPVLILGTSVIGLTSFSFDGPPSPLMLFDESPFKVVATGSFEARVLGFSGTPGAAPCHDRSTTTLAHRYGGLSQAAVALGYSSVKSLQADITLFCGS